MKLTTTDGVDRWVMQIYDELDNPFYHDFCNDLNFNMDGTPIPDEGMERLKEFGRKMAQDYADHAMKAIEEMGIK